MSSYAVLKRSVDEAVLNQNGSFHPMMVANNIAAVTLAAGATTLATVTLPAGTDVLYRIHFSQIDISAAVGTNTFSVTVDAVAKMGWVLAIGVLADGLDRSLLVTGASAAQSVIITCDGDESATVALTVVVERYFTQTQVGTNITIA